MFYPAEGEYMQLLGLPPVNLEDSNLHVCELLEINYRTPVGDKWVVVENIVIDSSLKDFLILKGEAVSGKAVRRIFIRMKRVRDRHDPDNVTEEWSVRFGSKVVKPPASLEREVERDYLQLVRRFIIGWLVLSCIALVVGGIGTQGFLAQIVVTGVLLGGTHVAQPKGNEDNRRYALRGLWMVILPLLAMIYANIYGLQILLT